MAEFHPVTHCIFDMDGLLLDTEGIYKDSFKQQLSKYDKNYTDELRAKVMGTTEKDSIKIIHSELNLPVTEEEFHIESKKIQLSKLSSAELMPGAERLVRHLSKSGIPICVATSSGKESVDLKTSNHKELISLFSHIVMGSSDPEVKKGKPNPDIFLIAANRFSDKPAPEKCLVFEDSVNGVKAANAAGMQVVMVPDKIITEEKRRTATIVLKSLEDFKPELFGLPPFPE
ncbi:pseudouridine-5'-phosphatase-like [Lycorma delicatula]|uniref:pseudouridine-5'-phosphatase-like n=1 Tax=Lycorma delicatula TaxID=130591 RepID=UPI003F51AACB